jgi:hypothetical protein
VIFEDLSRTLAILRRSRFLATSELELQAAIADLLTAERIPFEREARLTPGCTIDFLLAECIGLEVKVEGSPTAVTEQLFRYVQTRKLERLILATTRNTHRAIALTMDGFPLDVVRLRPPL